MPKKIAMAATVGSRRSCLWRWVALAGLLTLQLFSFSQVLWAQEAESEKRLLATAIQSVRRAESGLPDAEKLKLYGQALAALQKIDSDYATTDVALQISSSGKFGDFSVAGVREKYVRQSYQYYEKTCAVKPSLVCLGYAALNEGLASCRAGAIAVQKAYDAHESLLVALRLITAAGLASDDPIVTSLVQETISCPTGVVGGDNDVFRGFYLSKLAATFIEKRDAPRARAVVEKITHPLYKLKSVLVLKGIDSVLADRAYIDRLKKYISEQNNTFAGYLMGLSLLEFTLSQDRLTVTQDLARLVVPGKWEQGPPPDACHPLWAKELFVSLLNVTVKIGNLPSARLNRPQSVSAAEIAAVSKDIAGAQTPLRSIFSNCQRYYEMAVQGVGFLQALHRGDAASKFAKAALETDILDDPQRTIDSFVDLAYPNPEQSSGFDRAAADVGGLSISTMLEDERQGKNFLNRLPPSMRTQGGAVSIVALHARQGRSCEAASMLYTILKGKSLFSQGAMILANSNALSGGQKVDCGDEDLESLLK